MQILWQISECVHRAIPLRLKVMKIGNLLRRVEIQDLLIAIAGKNHPKGKLKWSLGSNNCFQHNTVGL